MLAKLSLLFSVIVFNMTKLLTTLQVKTGKALIKEPYSA